MSESEQQSGHVIGLVPALAFGVGTVVGGGVFTLSGTALNMAGPWAIASYLIAGAVMFLCALSFVVVSARAKPDESGYGPIGTILSPFWRFITMWGFYLNGATIIAFLLVSFGDYLEGYFLHGISPLLLGCIAAVAIVALNLGQTDTVAKAETGIVGLKLVILAVFAVWGILALRAPVFERDAPEGVAGVFGAAALVFTAYTGFNVIANMAGSIHNPKRTVPRAMLLTLLISTVIYIGVILAMLASGVTDFKSVGVAQAADALIGPVGGILIAFAACLSTLSGANANLLGSSEIVIRLVARGDIPPVFGRSLRKGHPYGSVIFLGIVTILLVLFAEINFIVSVASAAAAIAMVVVNIAAAVLAIKGWPGEGPRLPLGPTIPIIGAIVTAAQLPSLGLWPVVVTIVLTALGGVLYYFRHVTKNGEGRKERSNRRINELDTPLMRGIRRRSPKDV
ncbi:APC family permease [Leifsonia sp. A12D58]|uniref:APC family permease n=1 Tax=Leifsonia sp. A12D58 TaxID=3397674 RepID=UPI0039E11DA9